VVDSVRAATVAVIEDVGADEAADVAAVERARRRNGSR